MTKNAVSDWSTTPASNTDVGGVNLTTGMLPSDVNNAVQAMMAQLRTAIGASATSAFMQTVLDDADASTALSTLGFSTFIKTLIDDTTAAVARTTLGALGSAGDTMTGDLDMGSHNLKKAATLNGGPVAPSFRNKIINGDFDVWQRGTSFTPATNDYLADRFLIQLDGSGATRTITRQSHTVGQTTVPGNPKYFMRVAQSVAGSGATFNVIEHRVEGVSTSAGKTVTVTFYAAFASATTLPTIEVQQKFGTGGSPSTSVTTTVATSVAVGTSFTKVQYTVALPSISGKTLGTNGDDSAQLNIYMPLNTTFTLDISHVSIVEGDATGETDPFSPRHIQQELALCKRYLRAYGGNTNFERVTGGGYASSTTNVYTPMIWDTPMRATPSLTVSAAGDWAVNNNSGGQIAATAIALTDANPSAAVLQVTVASGLTGGNSADLEAFNRTTSRLYLSAEL